MTFAKSTGNIEAYQSSKDKLKETFVNWLTYTPGEDEFFFSYYPRWGSMLGFNVSYDSDAFNDHHFHYGYFTYAAALLCMEDPQFAADYGEILTLIAKDYANYDRNDNRFPFMRTLDPWCGHSWAGGMGDGGNDNGNGQESTSEAMQSWGGMYLLGVALNDKEMRDAGIWGWNTEARATREYWFDVDSPRPANDGGRKAWAGKNDRNGNYDYTQYKYAYNSNITGKGIGWWTWFGGDPLFMHGIQWMPVSPALDYLSWDNDFVDWAYQDMMSGANSDFSHEWFTSTVNSASGDIIEPLADNDWGNVTLAYMQRSRPAEAAEIFDRALKENRHIATAISTGHISYYLIHHHLTYGDIDFSVSADTPTASAYVKDGKYTYMVYNPEDTDKEVNFFRNGVKVYSVLAPAKKLTPFTSPAVPASLSATLPYNGIIPPGAEADLTVEVFDQYGAHAAGAAKPVFSSEGKYLKISADGTVSVNPSAPLGSQEVITVNSGDLTTTVTVSINHLPIIEDYIINGIPQFIEKGTLLHLSVAGKDQYGVISDIDINKWVLTNGEVSEEIDSDFLADTPGRFQLLAYGEDDMSAPLVSETIVILPTLPDVAKSAKAISSSEENVGTPTSNVNDGDSGSRWGSAHNDNEWIMLDLGEEYYLTVATVNWEAAFGKDYIFQVAPADAPLVEYTGNYAGDTKKYSIPAEQSWQTVSEVIGNTRSGNVASNINASGRYLRLKGLTRSTPYGYSIYEMEVRGMSLAGDDSSIAGIDAGTPEVGNQGEEIALRPVVFYRNGDSRDIDVVWSADKEARFDGNTFTPLGYGLYNLTAKYGEYRSSTPIFINEGVRMASITLSPDATIGICGEDLHIAVEAKNQFGGIYTLDDSNLTVTITDT
ncbi:MAG: discoidin domain-containing protein, partial [Muribaculaceae bacterium]|nr:discoidin domain-containing protein [Muribaculaceae bacterium]